jgi:hypothetical protein
MLVMLYLVYLPNFSPKYDHSMEHTDFVYFRFYYFVIFEDSVYISTMYYLLP